jgi:hypothetical protein
MRLQTATKRFQVGYDLLLIRIAHVGSTLQAARHLGFEEVPAIVIGHLTELQKRAYVIADNQLYVGA